MKKLLLTTALIACCLTSLLAQPCLPEGIEFDTQSQIDSFQVNYPGCTEIEGNVLITGNDITNLLGLNALTSISGDLRIGTYEYGGHWFDCLGNDQLIDLAGLNSLVSVGGDLKIFCNYSLVNLSGLENLISIGGELNIGDFTYWLYSAGNSSLISLTGLHSLISIGGGLKIANNESLLNFVGLGGLVSIAGKLKITNNESLLDFGGLENLISIGGDLIISNNIELSTLDGLNDIDPGTICNLSITNNASLVSCEVQAICDYLLSPNGIVNIKFNAPGCNTIGEIGSYCGISLPCLPFGNYYFHSQLDINSFQNYYPNCTELNGDVIISGIDISNLNGLADVISVEGNLTIENNNELMNFVGLESLTEVGEVIQIENNHQIINLTGLDNLTTVGTGINIKSNNELTSLTGLENLASVGNTFDIKNNNALISLSGLDNLSTISGGLEILNNDTLPNLMGLENLVSIGGRLWIYGNNNLSNFTGLSNLTSIGGTLRIGRWTPDFTNSGNPNLQSLSGIENLTSIGGYLFVQNNDNLASLVGLDNIDATSISNIDIRENNLLSICHVQSICDYLSAPSGYVDIWNNAPGCNSQQEVEEACLEVGIADIIPDPEISIYPNPATDEIFITTKNGNTIKEVNIYNQVGQRLIHKNQSTNMIDVSSLKQGMYVIEVFTTESRIREKLIIR